MGQGQEVHARRMVSQGMSQGGWLLLQNCHLSLNYVIEVMDNITDTEVIEQTFRLWVTTEHHPKFPISFLQVSHTLMSKMCWDQTRMLGVLSLYY